MLKKKIFMRLGGLVATMVLCGEIQAQSISSFVVASAGGTSTSIAGYTFDYTIGETIINTDTSLSAIVTQGFQQPVAGNTVLPITLLSFDGIKQTSGNLLSWETTNELNVKQFVLERSGSNNSVFSAIDTVLASGNGLYNKYNYLDASVNAGTFFYRLKMQDIDGKFTYSKILSFTNVINNVLPVKVYPTITNSLLNVAIYFTASTSITYTVTTISGSVQLKEKHTAIGASTQVLDVSKLAKGTYIILVDAGNLKWTGKFIKE